MRDKNTVFYRGNTQVRVDFSAEGISSDGAIVLVEELEKKHKLISYFSKHIKDKRHPLRTLHSTEKLLRQHVYALMQGYEEANDVEHLKNDPLFEDLLDGEMASQPTVKVRK